jgi:hypothetical protein
MTKTPALFPSPRSGRHRTHFEVFLQKLTRGREAAKVRLIIMRGEKNEASP